MRHNSIYMEEWRAVVGFEELYEVSSRGRVRTKPGVNYGHYKSGQIFSPGSTPQGYLTVGLWKGRVKTQRTVHSLVLEAFKGLRPPGKVSRHLDGVRTHNAPDNLEWGTYKENSYDRKGHGTANTGSRHGMSKLVENDVLRIRDMAAGGHTNVFIAREFGLTPSNVGYIVKRKTWSHIVDREKWQ